MGCLLSRKEAGGIAIREYHALGLPVLAPDTGGAPEHTIPEASVLIPPEAEAEFIAKKILLLEKDREYLSRLKRSAWEKRRTVLWHETVNKIERIIRNVEKPLH